MKKIAKLLVLSLLLVMYACGGGAKKDSLTKLKENYQKKKKELSKLQAELKKLEREINTKDPKFLESEKNLTLVSTISGKKKNFSSYLEVQGTVKTDDDVIITPEINGVITSLNAVEGQTVGAGQVLVTQNIDIVQKNMNQVQTQLKLAKTVYERQKRLWQQKIGTEIQYLQAQNNVEALEAQLQTLRSQSSLGTVVAPFTGVVEKVMAKRGQVALPGTPLMRIVGTNKMKVLAQMSEAYLKKVKIGDVVEIEFPSLDLDPIKANISRISSTISPETRTFGIEMNIRQIDSKLKPELIAMVKVKEGETNDALVIPTNLIQKDKTGYYVFLLEKKGKKDVVKKQYIKRGATESTETVVLEGLKGSEKIIKDNFNVVSDGMEVKLAKN